MSVQEYFDTLSSLGPAALLSSAQGVPAYLADHSARQNPSPSFPHYPLPSGPSLFPEATGPFAFDCIGLPCERLSGGPGYPSSSNQPACLSGNRASVFWLGGCRVRPQKRKASYRSYLSRWHQPSPLKAAQWQGDVSFRLRKVPNISGVKSQISFEISSSQISV